VGIYPVAAAQLFKKGDKLTYAYMIEVFSIFEFKKLDKYF